jgi:hypothetical protein
MPTYPKSRVSTRTTPTVEERQSLTPHYVVLPNKGKEFEEMVCHLASMLVRDRDAIATGDMRAYTLREVGEPFAKAFHTAEVMVNGKQVTVMTWMQRAFDVLRETSERVLPTVCINGRKQGDDTVYEVKVTAMNRKQFPKCAPDSFVVWLKGANDPRPIEWGICTPTQAARCKTTNVEEQKLYDSLRGIQLEAPAKKTVVERFEDSAPRTYKPKIRQLVTVEESDGWVEDFTD